MNQLALKRHDAPRRARKAPRQVRRSQLIDAAIDVIAEHGLSDATIANVTRVAGLSKGIVSLHFDSKDNLLTEVLRHLAVEMRDAWRQCLVDNGASGAAGLSAVVNALFQPDLCSPQKIAVWFAFFGEAKHRAAYREIIETFDDERVGALEALCSEVQTDGGYSDVDPAALALTIESLADGLWLSLLLYPEWMTPETAKTRIYEVLAVNFPDHFERAANLSDRPCEG